jgi:hypothetical protein
VRCPTHGVKQVRVAWAEPRSRFTVLFERLAIDVLRATDVQSAARILRVTWDEAWHLMERAVARGLLTKGLRFSRDLGIDEKAVAHGPQYATIVCDLARSASASWYIGAGVPFSTAVLDSRYARACFATTRSRAFSALSFGITTSKA